MESSKDIRAGIDQGEAIMDGLYGILEIDNGKEVLVAESRCLYM